ncbi:MAG TPA: hypothetical protein VFF73_19155 [Planctomycetota bacterium]|nr:hypothetical protein [Planctomycetota bacterium]
MIFREAPEALRKATEALRKAPEALRKAAEALRKAAEALRKAPEVLRGAPALDRGYHVAMKKRNLVLVAAFASGAALLPARADDPKTDGGIESALEAIAQVDSALSTWASTETADSELRRSVKDAPGLMTEAPQADPTRGLTYEAAAQNFLAVADQRLSDLAARIERRETDLIYGATAPQETPAPTGEPQDEHFDVRALERATPSAALPTFGIPVPAPVEERLKGDELGCEPSDLVNLVTCILSEEQGGGVDLASSTLGVHGSPASVAQVRATLERLDEVAGRRVQIDLRAFRLPRAVRSEVARLSDGIALTAEAEKKLEKDAVLVAEETLVAGDGRAVRAWRGDARTYVAGVAATASATLETWGRTLRTGMFAEVVPRLDPGEKTATVTVRFSLAAPRTGTRVKAFKGELELPEIELSRIACTATVPLGRSALVGGSFEASETPTTCVLALRAVLLPGPRPEAATPAPPADAAARKTLIALDKVTQAEVARLRALLPAIERALGRVRLARERHVEVLDVRDLLAQDAGALVLPRLGIASEIPPEEDTTPVALEPDRLVALIRRATGGDDAWAPPAWLSISRNVLVVRQTPSVLATVARVVERLRQERRGAVETEASLYRVPQALAATLAGALTPEALAKLDEALAKGDAALLEGGFVVSRPHERASLVAGRERAYVAGFTQAPSGTISPDVTLARTGFRLGLRARLERGRIALELEPSSARLRDLVRAETTNGPVFEPVLDLDGSAQELVLEDGHGFGFVRSRRAERAEGTVVLVVRARRFS